MVWKQNINKQHRMEAWWEGISENDRRMMNYEILQKNFRFPVRKLIRNNFWTPKRVWNFKHCQNIYFIDYIVTDNKRKSLIQA